MYKDKLNKLADFLDGLDESKFYFGSVVDKWVGDGRENLCGSVCCAIGWAPTLFPDEVQWMKGAHDNLAYNGNAQLSYGEIGAKLFDIPFWDAEALFSPNSTHMDDDEAYRWDEWGIHILYEEATPKELAANIRNYITMIESKDEHKQQEKNLSEVPE